MVLLTCLSSCRHFLRQHRRSVRSVIPRLGYKSISSISLHAYTVCLVHVVMSWTSSGEPGAQELIKAMLLVLAVCCKGDSYSVRRLPPRPRPSRPCCAWPFVDATSASVRLKLTVYRSTKLSDTQCLVFVVLTTVSCDGSRCCRGPTHASLTLGDRSPSENVL